MDVFSVHQANASLNTLEWGENEAYLPNCGLPESPPMTKQNLPA